MIRRLPIVVAGLCLAGCGGPAGPAGPLPADPDQLIVYSIDGPAWYTKAWKDLTSKDGSSGNASGVGGFPVLGKVVLTDPKDIRAVMTAIRNGVRDAKGSASCYVPRHAIRAVKDGTEVEMVICFQCNNYRTYRGGVMETGGSIAPDGEALLDRILSDAGVPLASKEYPGLKN
jgi:hypothetical protein